MEDGQQTHRYVKPYKINKMRSKQKKTQAEKAFFKKLQSVDNYIRKQQSLPSTMFLNSELLAFMKMDKEAYQIDNSLKLKEPQTIVFSQFKTAIYTFHNDTLPPNRSYVINIYPTNTTVSIHLILNKTIDGSGGKHKYKYTIQKNQGIMVKDSNWIKGTIIINSSRMSLMSKVKLCLDTIQTQFQTKTSVNQSQRKVVKKMVEDYIDKNLNKERISSIINKRRRESLTRIKSRSSSTAFLGSRASLSQQDKNMMIKSAQNKRDLVRFEGIKQKYLKHFEKMSPQKSNLIKNYGLQYLENKEHCIKNLAKLVYMLKFMSKIYSHNIKASGKKMKAIRGNILCKKFIKKMHHANKSRIPFKNREKFAFSMNTSALSCILYPISVVKAESQIIECFRRIYFKNAVVKAAQKSKKLKESVLLIQRYEIISRKRSKDRFRALVAAKKHDFIDEKQEKQCFDQYTALCRAENRKNKAKKFICYHLQLNHILERARKAIYN